MNPVRPLASCWRLWAQPITRQSLKTRFPPSVTSRELSYLAAESRSQLRSRLKQTDAVRRRWNSSSTLHKHGENHNSIESTSSPSAGLTHGDQKAASQTEPLKRDEPAYEITFTCKPCQTRSKHRISKQGYHKGTILITCPDCKNRHLICDHLNIFRDKSTTIEDILKEKGEMIKRGTLGVGGDIELWDDDAATDRPDTNVDAKPAAATKTTSQTEQLVP